MTPNRVAAITGMGIVCGLGHNLTQVWNGITEGKPGISTLENVDTEKLAVKFGGQVKEFSVADDILSEREQPRYDRFLHFTMASGYEAFRDAGLDGDHPYDATRMGSILGVGMGGFPEMQRTTQVFLEKGPRRVSPFFIPGIIPNMSSGLLSIRLGLQGLNYSVSSACASAAHAITSAAYEIMFGRQDVMITGGAESVLSEIPIQGFISMKALSKRNEAPANASRPFDKDRDGFVMGEGAGVLVLENYDKAVARGAKIYAEVVGHGATSDAHHITAPHPEGEGASRCMKMAIESAGLKPEQIGYVNAHGTSTPLGDIGETKAIRQTFGAHADNLKVSSTKSMTATFLALQGN